MVCSCETEHVSGQFRPGGSLVVQLDRRGGADGAGEGLTPPTADDSLTVQTSRHTSVLTCSSDCISGGH